MREKTFLIFLCLLFAATSFAMDQEKVIGENTVVKAVIEDSEPGISPLILTRDKPGCQMLVAYALDEDGILMQMIELAANSYIDWLVEYTALFNTTVRFHFIWSGPEYYEHTTDWVDVVYKRYQYTYVTTNDNWKKGVYTLTIVAEHDNLRAGSEAVATCRVRLY